MVEQMNQVQPGAGPLASVVIPAHNEEHALQRHLESVLAQDLGDLRLEVAVVVNGSTDGTVPAAKAFVDRFAARGHRLEVVNIPTASKAAALNEGERHVSAFPRLYLDADIELSRNAIRRTVEVLSARDTPMLAAPTIRVAEGEGIASRHYGRVWADLPYIRLQVPGVGFYAVNEAGRQRWWRFPTRLGADDKFVRLQFGDDEAVVVEDASFDVYFPQRLGELLRVRGRWTSFNHDIARYCPGLDRGDRARWPSSIRHVATRPSMWLSVPAFVLIWSGAWVLAHVRKLGIDQDWSRASSSPMRASGTAASPADDATQPATVPTRSHPRPAAERTIHAGVVTHNSSDTAPSCIQRILESRDLDALHVTVVDNSSTDGGAGVLDEMFPDVEIVTNDTNIGFAAAVNQAFEHSTSRWLAIVNPDAEIRPESIGACIDYLEAHDATGVCGAPSVYADGTPNDRSYFLRPTLWSELTLAVGAHRLAPASRVLNPEQYVGHQDLEAALRVDAIAGCFTVIERSLFDHLGGYDEGYFLCGEDLDLGTRAAEAGASPTVVPIEPILHRSAQSFSTAADARVAYLRGRAEYEHRWWSPRRAAVGDAIRRAAMFGRLVASRVMRSGDADAFAEIWDRRREWSPD